MNQKLLDSIHIKIQKAEEELFRADCDLEIVASLLRQAADQAEMHIVVDEGVLEEDD